MLQGFNFHLMGYLQTIVITNPFSLREACYTFVKADPSVYNFGSSLSRGSEAYMKHLKAYPYHLDVLNSQEVNSTIVKVCFTMMQCDYNYPLVVKMDNLKIGLTLVVQTNLCEEVCLHIRYPR